MNDDQYRGYDIPANTVVIPNVWSVLLVQSILRAILYFRRRAMTRDEQVYPDAHKFNPDRFLNRNGPETDPKDFVFGFGRRQALRSTFWQNLKFWTLLGYVRGKLSRTRMCGLRRLV